MDKVERGLEDVEDDVMSSWPNSSGLLYPTRSSPTRDVRVWLRHNRRAMKTYSARHSNRVAQRQIWNPGVEKSLKSMICTHALLVVTVMGVPCMEPEAYQTNVERDMRLDSSRPRMRLPKMTPPRTLCARCVLRIPPFPYDQTQCSKK